MGLAFIASVAIVPWGIDVPGVAVKARCVVRCANAVKPMMGNPASITPTDPGNTQSGNPIAEVAAHAGDRDDRGRHGPDRDRAANADLPPRRIAGAAVPLPLVVMESSTRAHLGRVTGPRFGGFGQTRHHERRERGRTSGRTSSRSGGGPPMCAARSFDGELPWNGSRPPISS